MRIPVSVIVGQLAAGATPEEVLRDFPDLEREDIQQALAYSAWLAHEEVHPA
jgi:predicted nuclease of predicted toxin-antitoxin system